jgi:hypothetical protein
MNATISRGRKNVVVFTSDKAQLRANILQSGDRDLALDLKIDTPTQRAQMAFRREADFVHQVCRHQAMMHHSGHGGFQCEQNA